MNDSRSKEIATQGVGLRLVTRVNGSERYQLEKPMGCPYGIIGYAAQAANDNPHHKITLDELHEAVYGAKIPPYLPKYQRAAVEKRLRGFIRNAKSLSIKNERLPMLITFLDKSNATSAFRLATKEERDLEIIRRNAARDTHMGEVMLSRGEAQESFAKV